MPADGTALGDTDGAGPHGTGPGPSDLVDLLSHGDLTVRGRLVDASNVTLHATVNLDGVQVRCVYKPVAGERPLWDFPSRTLALREAAAYQLSAATGWDVVPPTVFRREGPFGAGSVQCWVDTAEVDTAEVGTTRLVALVAPQDIPPGWLHVLRGLGDDGNPLSLVHADDPALRRMAVFDVVANNADRKGSHVLRGVTGGLSGVDHGLTFHVEDKLRTVLWGWAGQRLPDDVLEVLRDLDADLDTQGPLHQQLRRLLTPAEVDRTASRIRRLRRTGRHPRPGGPGHPIPWPAL